MGSQIIRNKSEELRVKNQRAANCELLIVNFELQRVSLIVNFELWIMNWKILLSASPNLRISGEYLSYS